MKIFSPNFITNFYTNQKADNNKPQYGLKYQHNLYADTFVPSKVHFGANTSNGTFLKYLKNVRGAYSDAVPLKGKEYERIKTQLFDAETTEIKLDVLKPFVRCMLPVERNIYRLLLSNNKMNPHLDMTEVLQRYYKFSLEQLGNEQKKVFNKIGEFSSTLSPEKQEKVNSILDNARERITLSFDDMNKFKRKSFIDSLIRLSREDDIQAISDKISTLPPKQKKTASEKFDRVLEIFNTRNTDTNINGKTPLEMIDDSLKEYGLTSKIEPQFEQIIDTAHTLPTSKNSTNAFIVKYSARPENEIAERLVSESLATIEHIVAKSHGGENEAYNFVLTTKSRNAERGNEPVSEFKKKHPELVRTFQHNMDDVIREGNKGHLNTEAWYPYVVKETIKQEYGFDIDISNYKIPPEEAFLSFPKRLREKFPQFTQYYSDEPFYKNKKKSK